MDMEPVQRKRSVTWHAHTGHMLPNLLQSHLDTIPAESNDGNHSRSGSPYPHYADVMAIMRDQADGGGDSSGDVIDRCVANLAVIDP